MAEPSDEWDDTGDSPGGSSSYIGKGAPKFGIEGPDGLPCEKCPKDIPLSFCPHWPCNICYNDHYHQVCPYFDFYPQGAPLSPFYDIICSMGHPFNEEKWVCTSCPGNEARISLKYCHICHCRLHGTYECPEDKVAAAKYKLFRDEMCSKVFKLNPPKSSYVPTPSPGFVNMKEGKFIGSTD
ncbi:PREDICTED: uncharacterized protein LOC101292361 isoform 1 [Fragaria vesca subsp. vesca]